MKNYGESLTSIDGKWIIGYNIFLEVLMKKTAIFVFMMTAILLGLGSCFTGETSVTIRKPSQFKFTPGEWHGLLEKENKKENIFTREHIVFTVTSTKDDASVILTFKESMKKLSFTEADYATKKEYYSEGAGKSEYEGYNIDFNDEYYYIFFDAQEKTLDILSGQYLGNYTYKDMKAQYIENAIENGALLRRSLDRTQLLSELKNDNVEETLMFTKIEEN